jgi:hypothetical protein
MLQISPRKQRPLRWRPGKPFDRICVSAHSEYVPSAVLTRHTIWMKQHRLIVMLPTKKLDNEFFVHASDHDIENFPLWFLELVTTLNSMRNGIVL